MYGQSGQTEQHHICLDEQQTCTISLVWKMQLLLVADDYMELLTKLDNTKLQMR